MSAIYPYFVTQKSFYNVIARSVVMWQSHPEKCQSEEPIRRRGQSTKLLEHNRQSRLSACERMRKNLRKHLFLIFFLLFPFLTSCSAPSSYEKFLDILTYKKTGSFKYKLDMFDSLSVYDISFYTGIDCTEKEFAQMSDIQMDISLISPAGTVYKETVYLLRETYTKSDLFSKTYKIKYRADLIPKEFGQWIMVVKLPEIESYKGLRGLGIILDRNGKK